MEVKRGEEPELRRHRWRGLLIHSPAGPSAGGKLGAGQYSLSLSLPGQSELVKRHKRNLKKKSYSSKSAGFTL